MAKLALAVGEASRPSVLLGAQVVLSLDRRTADAAAKAGGRDILLYELVQDDVVHYLARGHVAQLTYQGDRDPIQCRIDRVQPFLETVVSGAETKLTRVKAMLALTDERFADIMKTDAAPAVVANEAAVAPPRPSPQTYATIGRQVLERWDYRCAITGERFPGATGAGSDLHLVPIRPRELGGPLHARNFLPLVDLAAEAWRSGVIGVDADLNIRAQQNRLSPDLLERVCRDGKLLVPDDPDLGPDPAFLAYHWLYVCGRWAP